MACPICERGRQFEHLVFGWRVCLECGFAFLLDETGALVEQQATNYSRARERAAAPAARPAINPPRFKVNGVPV